MSKLEQDALPILKALVDYQKHIILSQAEILSLAWWIWKTVLTLHSASVYEKVIPAHHYELAFNQKAPAHFMIHIAHLESRIDAPSWIQNQNWQGAERHLSGETLINALRQTYRITIGFGHLAARVMYFPLELPLFPLEEGIISIHPPSQDITWPPQTSINDLWELDRGVVVPQPLPPLNLDDTLANKQADQ